MVAPGLIQWRGNNNNNNKKEGQRNSDSESFRRNVSYTRGRAQRTSENELEKGGGDPRSWEGRNEGKYLCVRACVRTCERATSEQAGQAKLNELTRGPKLANFLKIHQQTIFLLSEGPTSATVLPLCHSVGFSRPIATELRGRVQS